MSRRRVRRRARLRHRNLQQVVEYLYVDTARLSSYVDQLRAPVTYDRVPSWSIELSIPSPSAKAGQSQFAREYTLYEQIAFLEERLTENGQLAQGRWNGDQYPKEVLRESGTFRIESCLARRDRYGCRVG
jgi:hypothetical protein